MTDLWSGNFRSCCRLCLNDNRHHLRPIFDGSAREKDLQQRILQFVSVKISPSDQLSTLLCRDCTRRLDAWSTYHQNCVSNQGKLSEWMKKSSGTEMMLDPNVQIKSEPLDLDVIQLEENHEIEHQQIHIKDEPMDQDMQEQDDYPPQLLPFQIMEEHFSEDSQETVLSHSSFQRNDVNFNDAIYCSICNKTFSNAANKRRHDTYLHNKEKTPMQRSQISEIPKTVTPDKKARKPFPVATSEEDGEKDKEATKTSEGNQEQTTEDKLELTEKNANENTEDKSLQNDTEEPNEGTTNEETADEEKLEFVAGLKLVRKDSPTPTANNNNTDSNLSKLSKIELSYLEKCKAMVNMYNTLECACHNVQHANLRGLLSHLRALRIWFPLFTCYHCMISFTDRQTYSRHNTRCSKVQLQALTQLSNLKERSPMKRRLYQNFKCSRCNYLYTFYEEYCNHVNDEHSTGQPPFFCTTCRSRFDDVEAYREHIYQQCMITYYCDICFITTSSLDEFETHAKETHDSSEGFVLLQDDNYIKVKRNDKVVAATSAPRVDPAIADEHGVQVSGKRERRQSLRNPNMVPHPDSDDDGQAQAPPPKVAKVSPARGPAKCPACEKDYSNSFNMIRHYKKAHPELINQMHLNGEVKNEDAESGQPSDDSYYSCPDCGGVYDSVTWSQHVKSHPLEQCGECSKTFQFKSELEHHRSVHLTLKISRDSKTRSYRSSMLSLDEEEDMHMCDICEQIFTSEDDLNNHKVSHVNQEEENEEVDPETLEEELPPMLPVSTELVEEEPAKEETKAKFFCDICSREYGSWKSLREHTRVKHPEHHITRKSDYPKQCEYCDKVCMTGASLTLHKQMHERMVTEIQQKNGGKSGQTSKSHKEEDDPDESYHTCRFCFKVFSSKYNLKEHLRSHGVKHQKKPKPASTKKHICEFCDDFYESLEELNAHKQAEHGEESENSDGMPILTNELDIDPKIPVNIYTCDTCVLTFPSKAALKKHKETHKNENHVIPKTSKTAVYCKYCRIAFNTETDLSNHMSAEHDVKPRTKKTRVDDKPFKCPTCKKGFNSLAAMNAHAGWHKRGIAKYPPPPATTPQQAAIVKQEKMIKAAKKVATAAASKAIDQQMQVPPNQCSTCLIELPNETALKIHVLEKHGNVSEVMLVPRCNTCNQDFQTQQEYEKHLRFHDFLERQKRHEMEIVQQRQLAAAPSQKPRHPCKHCSSEFSRSDTLTHHMRQKHPHLMETQFKCTQCDRTFDKQNSLSIHLKVHDKQKVPLLPAGKFACSICNARFVFPKELRDHTISAHPF